MSFKKKTVEHFYKPEGSRIEKLNFWVNVLSFIAGLIFYIKVGSADFHRDFSDIRKSQDSIFKELKILRTVPAVIIDSTSIK